MFGLQSIVIHAQQISGQMSSAKTMMDKGKYEKTLSILKTIDTNSLEVESDSTIMMYNYMKGASLYHTGGYEEALPFLKKGLMLIDKMPHDDCNYLELIYGIGSCYYKLELYEEAEKYFRKVYIKSLTQNFKCDITTTALSELAEVYVKLGKPELADLCTSKIETIAYSVNTSDWEHQIDELYDLAEAYNSQNNQEEYIETYNKILNIIVENEGKVNEDYLLYSSLLGMRLQYNYDRKEDALLVYQDMIEVGKKFSQKRPDVCNAYEDYLRIASMLNMVEAVKTILPEAVLYYSSTKNRNRQESNLYEIVGNGFCQSGNYDIGVAYLEKEWNGQKANSILALTNLGSYYYYSEPAKAIQYYKNAEQNMISLPDVNDNTKGHVYESIMYLSSNIGNIEEAIKYGDKSIPYIKESKDLDYYARHLIQLAVLYTNAEKSNKSVELFNEVYTIIDDLNSETIVSLYSNQGFCYIKSNELEKSISILSKGVAFTKQSLGEHSRWLETLYHNLGRAFMLSENYKSAKIYLKSAIDLQNELEGNANQRTIDYYNECFKHD